METSRRGALGVEDEVDAFADYRPRFNIAPTDQHFIITSEFERRKAQRARWGLVNRWARDNRRASQCINAKAETLEQRPSFSEAFQQRRCIVPADGFYEWAGPKAKRQPLWIHPRAGGLLRFAGLYESWYPEKDRPELTFTIVTCAASATITAIHDRMPVVLDERAAEDWMNPRERDPLSLKRLLVPAPHDLLAVRPASPLVNSVKTRVRRSLSLARRRRRTYLAQQEGDHGQGRAALHVESGPAAAENSHLQINGKFTILRDGPIRGVRRRRGPVPSLLQDTLAG